MEPRIESKDEQSRWHTTAGNQRGDDGDFAGAVREYSKAARLEPENPAKLAKLAEGYAAADLPHKAFDLYQRALRTQTEQGAHGDLTEIHLGMGDLCRTFARSAAAVRSYERAVRARPKMPFYRWKLAVALAAMGLYDKAAHQLETALSLAPEDSFYHFQLADVYLLLRRDEDAVTELREAVNFAPRDDYYHLRLGAALLRVNRPDEALPCFERAVDLKPDLASYHTLLRYALARDGREPEISVEVEMVELHPFDQDFVRRIRALAGVA